jgi:hypothetical protein
MLCIDLLFQNNTGNANTFVFALQLKSCDEGDQQTGKH